VRNLSETPAIDVQVQDTPLDVTIHFAAIGLLEKDLPQEIKSNLDISTINPIGDISLSDLERLVRFRYSGKRVLDTVQIPIIVHYSDLNGRQWVSQNELNYDVRLRSGIISPRGIKAAVQQKRR